MFDIQPSGHVGTRTVVGTGGTVAPFAHCLQIYFCFVSQSRTSHNPAAVPVFMATHPGLFPLGEKKEGKKNYQKNPKHAGYFLMCELFNSVKIFEQQPFTLYHAITFEKKICILGGFHRGRVAFSV